MTKTIALVTPVLDDWDAFTALLSDIADTFAGSGIVFYVYAVDDGSSVAFDVAGIALSARSCIASVDIIRLAANLGHQRAIAVGLCAIVEDDAVDAVLVMDSDGQDRPDDIAALLAESARHPRHVVLAGRAKRGEPPAFRFWYRLYRMVFRALTGRAIDFGNFCLIPTAAARRLVYMSDLWNNLAACVIRSRLPFTTVPTIRGTRSSGESKMTLATLIVHGLSAMSVYSDVIFARVLLGAGGIAALTAIGIVGVAIVRVATDLAVPGWATAALGDLLIIVLQTFVVAIAASLTMLARRGTRPIVPAVDCAAFVAERERCRRDRHKTVIGLARPVA
ncbi:MAG TPA: glycosyltransferase [Stellaceae bacterium]|nr:glycosyltransferase [Stellaceae bacterium]